MKIESIALFISLIIVAVYLGGLIRVIYYEWKINKLHETINDRIAYERSQPQSQTTINGRIERVKIIHNPELEKLERKRRFILDKLPFIRK